MTKVTVPNDVCNKLLQGLLHSREGVELCDASGFTLGYLKPSADLVLEPPPLSEEELKRRETEPCYTTDEVLAHLRSL